MLISNKHYQGSQDLLRCNAVGLYGHAFRKETMSRYLPRVPRALDTCTAHTQPPFVCFIISCLDRNVSRLRGSICDKVLKAHVGVAGEQDKTSEHPNTWPFTR